MMILNYVIMDLDGIYPVSVGAGLQVPDGALIVGDDAIRYLGRMLVSGVWQDRPVIADPVVMSDGVVTFSGLPDGTSATIVDAETGSILGTAAAAEGAIEFQLVDAGTYSVEVTPPTPTLPWRGVIRC